jgi:hypothetical protein
MEDFLKPVSTVKRAQSNLESFKAHSMTKNQNLQSQNVPSKRLDFEILPSTDDPSTNDLPLKLEASPLIETISTQPTSISIHKSHKIHDTAAFLQQVYLQKSGPNTLPDDAREILKSQPDDENLLAVLHYLQYGIEGQHDFSIRGANAKAAQIVNVLVTVTLPDHWPRLSLEKLSKEEKQMKNILLSCLTSPAGIGALVAQIRKISIPQTSSSSRLAIKEAVSALSRVLAPTNILSTFLDDVLNLKDKPAQRNALWQELCSLLGGSKVLAIVTQALVKLQETESGNTEDDWLGDGKQYTVWLAHRIASAAIKIQPNDSESCLMLMQLLKRGMNLGYRGKSRSKISFW